MANIIVQYNGVTISPTPLVSHSYNFIDYGKRWGNSVEIDLNGNLTGIIDGITGNTSILTNIFSGQFGTLTVMETGTTIYSWPNIVIEEIAFSSNKFSIGTMAPYSVKMRSYNVPSGIIEPTNEYSFALNEDGLGQITHKISAKGIKNSSGALNNAINFVRNFTGINPFQPCFVPSGLGVLFSLSENIDRASCTYTVNELYKYNTGSLQPFVELFTLNISDIFDNDFLTLESSLKILGSPIHNNLSQIESLFPLSLTSRIQDLGINTTFLAQSSFSAVRDSGAATIDIKSSYISGYSSQDVLGFFDYTIELDNDLILPKENWKIDGEFVCKGPLDYKLQQLNSFKSTNGNNWFGYLEGLITSSPTFATYHTGGNTMSSLGVINIQENTGLATFRISMTTKDGAERGGSNPKYSVDVEPSKWNYNLLPSANIEGYYVIQDPQMMSRAKISINVSAEISGKSPLDTFNIFEIMGELSGIYVNSGNLIQQNLSTGFFDISYQSEWIGDNIQSSGLLFTKTVGSIASDWVRVKGFDFGF